jgi:hypothetical protein
MPHVAYAIDHKLRRHDTWTRHGMQTTLVNGTDPTQQAAEIAERFELHRAPVVQGGQEIRVRVWHFGTDEELYALDPEHDESLGQWTYGPIDRQGH